MAQEITYTQAEREQGPDHRDPAPVVLFRQYGTDRYAEAPSVTDGIRRHFTHQCAECGADLTSEPTEPIVAAALFVMPPAEPSLTPSVTGYAIPTCLDCAPVVTQRIAASMAELDGSEAAEDAADDAHRLAAAMPSGPELYGR